MFTTRFIFNSRGSGRDDKQADLSIKAFNPILREEEKINPGRKEMVERAEEVRSAHLHAINNG